ncbi:allophanate hydrolase subunit 1 [Polymorphospora sp. NPDC050346]|uniref:5-oxoprolinase subunit B family protein n=1 Tax=Polymorphospora sp. NPDC050346 TaxID=3155780 RepID=UPI0033CB1011
MRIRRAGAGALLLECDDGAQVEAWRAELWRQRDAGRLAVTEIVPAARTVLLDGLADPAATAALIAGWPPPPAATGPTGPLVEIPTRYDGPDLAAVAGHWGIPPADAVRRLVDTEFQVAFAGFAPGFAYLRGLPEGCEVPRLPTPRAAVPAGSVALAGPYAGIYPTASPGGWQLVGHTDATLFDVHREPPALLVPGTRVRLVAR